MSTKNQLPPRLNRLWTAAEIAEQTGEPLQTVYTLAREHGMPHIRFGRAIRFDPQAVSAWLAAGGTGGRGESS